MLPDQFPTFAQISDWLLAEFIALGLAIVISTSYSRTTPFALSLGLGACSEGSITGGWGGDFEIDYWSLLPAGVRVYGQCTC
eukprot:SAG25_NODE_241_length_11184_cov_4.090934_4_plen_82_part_00